MISWFRAAIVLCVLLLGITTGGCASQFSGNSDGVYHLRSLHDPDGTGKVYMGREIAQVMGYQGAAWLERPSRGFEERPDQVVAALDLAPTDVVADIGAGTGYLSVRLGDRVPEGKVLAVDVQPQMVQWLQERVMEEQIPNLQPVLGKVTDPNLPAASVDLALMVDAYHEFAYPREMMQGIVEALKPGGRAVLVEYRGENPLIPIKRLHKMTQQQVKKEMQAVGLMWIRTDDRLPQQHLMVFQKPE